MDAKLEVEGTEKRRQVRQQTAYKLMEISTH